MHTTTINIQNAESAHVGKLKTFPGSETHGPFFTREIVVACDGGGRTVIKLFSDTPEGCEIHGLTPTPEITRNGDGTLTSTLPPVVTDDIEAGHPPTDDEDEEEEDTVTLPEPNGLVPV